MKFTRDKSFDSQFSEVKDTVWYPYVGKTFGSRGRRIMIYAHNIPVKPQEYDLDQFKEKDPAFWADSIDQYTYDRYRWTEAFRYFVKGAVGLADNFNAQSPASIISRVEAFIHEIAYLNFIQGLVKSDLKLAVATKEQICHSKAVNREYLRILQISHCICWGKPTYEYVKSLAGFHVISEKGEGKKGFSSCVLDTGTSNMHVLRVYHPSMPAYFSPYSKDTQGIISRFLCRDVIDTKNKLAESTATMGVPHILP